MAETVTPKMADTLPGPLVDADWLAYHLDHVRVVDVRWYLDGRSGHEAFLTGHIPGAVWLDLDHDLADPPGRGRHPLPSPERFADALGRAGIGEDTPVVAYDDAGGSVAARLWWLLTLLGHPAAVLDGGLDGWPGPLETEVVEPQPTTVRPRPFPTARLADADEVEEATRRGDTRVLDARTAARYEQGDPAIDARPGHIPGALSAPWAANLDSQGRFQPAPELRRHYLSRDVGPGRDVIAYCGSGVTACHDLLALSVAGVPLTSLRLYPGSWSEWGADPARPVAVGPEAGGAGPYAAP